MSFVDRECLIIGDGLIVHDGDFDIALLYFHGRGHIGLLVKWLDRSLPQHKESVIALPYACSSMQSRSVARAALIALSPVAQISCSQVSSQRTPRPTLGRMHYCTDQCQTACSAA